MSHQQAARAHAVVRKPLCAGASSGGGGQNASSAGSLKTSLDGWKANIDMNAVYDGLADTFVSAGKVPFRFVQNRFHNKVLGRIPGFKPRSRKVLVARAGSS